MIDEIKEKEMQHTVEVTYTWADEPKKLLTYTTVGFGYSVDCIVNAINDFETNVTINQEGILVGVKIINSEKI